MSTYRYTDGAALPSRYGTAYLQQLLIFLYSNQNHFVLSQNVFVGIELHSLTAID